MTRYFTAARLQRLWELLASNSKTQVLFEWIEVAIVVQQWEASLDAKRRNPTVDGLTDRETL